MITRSVRGRTFLLRPSKKTNGMVGYVVAYVAGKYGIQIHAIMVMSNHWHVVVTDPRGKVVEFQRECHSLIGRGVNCIHGDFESLWASEQTSRVACAEPEDLIGKIAYTMANPVEAGLVRYGHSWPGIRRAWPQAPVRFARPVKFFSKKMPASAQLVMHRPPGFDEHTDEELGAMVKGAIEQREDHFRQKADKEGKRFLGRKAILSQSRYGQPSTHDPRFGISPRVAAGNRWTRIERLQGDKAWLEAHDRALQAWRAGNREVVFPHGTYQMRVIHAVQCAGPPT